MNTKPALSFNTTTTITNINFSNFLPFSLDNYTALSPRWQSYKMRYKNLCTELNIRNNRQKLALFLTYIGEKCFNVCKYVNVPGRKKTSEEQES